jgi:hypothetical protein
MCVSVARVLCCVFDCFYRLALLLVYLMTTLVLLFSLSLLSRATNAHGLKYCGTHDEDEEEEEDVGEGLIHSGGSVHRCGWRPFASPSGLRNFHRLESTPSSRSARSAKSFKSRMISEAVVVVVVEAP